MSSYVITLGCVGAVSCYLQADGCVMANSARFPNSIRPQRHKLIPHPYLGVRHNDPKGLKAQVAQKRLLPTNPGRSDGGSDRAPLVQVLANSRMLECVTGSVISERHNFLLTLIIIAPHARHPSALPRSSRSVTRTHNS